MPTVPAPTVPPAAAVKRFTEFNAPLETVYDEDASFTLDRDYWRVSTPFKFYLDDLTEEKWVAIPAQYLTDGASVPRFFWNLLPPWGRYGQAAVIHDWLCEQLSIDVKGVPTPITRATADKAFKQGMEALNVPRWKRNVMYIAVRVYSKYSELRAKLGLSNTTLARAYVAKKAYMEEYPTMVEVDNETVPFDT